MDSQHIVGGLFILIAMGWTYALSYALIDGVITSIGKLVVTYYKAKSEWLTTLARETLAGTKKGE